jgi:pyridoxine 4-dehydrogenase
LTEQKDLAGSFTLPGNSMTLKRMGYGAMQLAGPGVWGPPKDVNAAIAVLREAVESGVNHIDTSDYYGPYVTNQLIKQALHPYRTSSLEHLRENLQASTLQIPPEVIADLDAIGTARAA